MLCTKPPSDRIASSRVATSSCRYLGLSSVTGTPLRCRCAVASASNLSPPPPPFLDAASDLGLLSRLGLRLELRVRPRAKVWVKERVSVRIRGQGKGEGWSMRMSAMAPHWSVLELGHRLGPL